MTERNPGQPPTQDRPPSREDRPPEVRRYLDALGAEIHDRQKKFGIATREDAKRVAAEHTDLDGLEELVRLMERFRTVFEANTMTEEQASELERLEAPAKGAEAFRKFVEIVESVTGDQSAYEDGVLAIVRGFADAGELGLAEKIYKMPSKRWNPGMSHISNVSRFALTHLAIWEVFFTQGKLAPFSLESIQTFAESARFTSEEKIFFWDTFVRLLSRQEDDAERLIEIAERHLRGKPILEILFFLREQRPDSQFVKEKLKAFESEDLSLSGLGMQAWYLIRSGQFEKLDAGLPSDSTSLLQERDDFERAWGCSVGYAQTGRNEEAFRELERLNVPVARDFHFFYTVMEVVRAFLERGNVQDAIRAMALCGDDSGKAEAFAYADDSVAKKIVAGFLSHPEGRDLAVRFTQCFTLGCAKPLGSTKRSASSIDTLCDLIVLLRRHGEEVGSTVEWIRREMFRRRRPFEIRQDFAGIDAFLALKTFRDAAHTWMASPGLAHRGRARQDWVEKMRGAAGTHEDLLNAITYEDAL